MAKKILIVEDNARNRTILKDILAYHSYTVIEAENGEKGIEAAKKENPDAILMDLQMPKVDGYKAVGELRRLPAFAATPIIAVTSSAMNTDRNKVMAAGFTDYVSKPFNMKELVALVKRYTGG